MTPERWKHVKSIFEAVLEEPAAARPSFLRQACGDDEALRKEVEALLTSHEAATAEHGFASSVLSDATLRPELPPPPAQTGQRIGPYRILREIARGGMGAVYLAERDDDQFRKQVAVKLVRHGLDGDAMHRRFRAERQILARLEHPLIARLIDGGVTENGVPYLVMEYVEGKPIDVYCDARQLSATARLLLFQAVCEAVHHAHQNLVIHRDLKPGNILVTERGRVKLLDFGIAKLLDQDADRTDTFADALDVPVTRTGMRVMTLDYAAPEQVRGEAVTTASDVYALGVILYELLTGQRPYRLNGLTPGEAERVICERDPARPSTVVTRAAEAGATRPASPAEVSRMRATEPGRLRRRLTGDLDTIVLKALRKDPSRRYRSAEQLSEDLRRHLTGLPVQARPETFAYVTAKFIRRHRVGVAAALLVLLSLLGGIATTTWQAHVANQERQKAEQRFADLRQLSSSFLFELHDAIADLPGSTAARELLVQRSLIYLDKLAQEARSDPSLLLELATAYRKVGDVQGNPSNANLGQTQGALESYRTALRVARDALALGADSTDARRTLALIQERTSDVQAAIGDLEGADASMHAALALYRSVALRQADDPLSWKRYAVGLIKMGDLSGNPNFANRTDTTAALRYYLDARPLLDSLHAADPSRANVARLRGLIHERIGTMHELQGDLQAALEAFHASLALRKDYAARHPDHVDAIRDLAVGHEKIGDMSVRAGDLDEALNRYRHSREIFEQLWRADTMNVQARLSLAISDIHLGDLAGYPEQPNLGDRTLARSHYRTALGALEALYAADSTNTRIQFLKGLVEGRLAMLTR